MFKLKSPFKDFYDPKHRALESLIEDENFHGRVQCAIHMLCSLLSLIATITQVDLPYKLSLDKLGYSILDSSSLAYPLYLLIEAPLSVSDLQAQKPKLEQQIATKLKLRIKHQIRFEQGVVLLDKNI